MASDLAEKYAQLKEKQQENESLRREVSLRYTLLLQAFWQNYQPLVQVDNLFFTQLEFKAWIEKKTDQRSQI